MLGHLNILLLLFIQCFFSFPEFKFCVYTASMLAGAAIVAALRGLRWTTRGEWNLDTLMDFLVSTLGVERVSIFYLYQKC